MLRVVVLGAAAGGGVPQWNCGCPVCQSARSQHPELQSTQASIAVSADGGLVVAHNSPAIFAAYRDGDQMVTLT